MTTERGRPGEFETPDRRGPHSRETLSPNLRRDPVEEDARRLGPLIAGLDGATLRHLAAIADKRDRPKFVSPERAVEELTAMAERGDRPALGWWRRNTIPRPRPSGNAADWQRRASTPAVYVRVLRQMVADGYGKREAAEVVADMALEDGVDRGVVRQIVAEALHQIREQAAA